MTYPDSRESDGGVPALSSRADIPVVAQQAVSLLGTRVLSQLCGVTKESIGRYARGVRKPSPENAARIRFALTLGTLIKYKHSSRVAATFFDVLNPWLDYHYPVEVLANHGPGGEEWDRVGFACAAFLWRREQCSESPDAQDEQAPSNTRRD